MAQITHQFRRPVGSFLSAQSFGFARRTRSLLLWSNSFMPNAGGAPDAHKLTPPAACGFCLGTLTCFDNKHTRNYLASRRLVPRWGHVTHGARALQPNELGGFGWVSRKRRIYHRVASRPLPHLADPQEYLASQPVHLGSEVDLLVFIRSIQIGPTSPLYWP